MNALTLSAVEVGEVLGYRAEQVRRLARDGRIPGPIDPDLNPKLWRWSHAELLAYVNRTPFTIYQHLGEVAS